MKHTEADLNQARRHVEEGAEHIRRQTRLIATLKADGHATAQAKELLETMLESQRLHEAEFERISNELKNE